MTSMLLLRLNSLKLEHSKKAPSSITTASGIQKNSAEFNYIRMRQTGPNWCGDDYLGFKSFEIYGVLK